MPSRFFPMVTAFADVFVIALGALVTPFYGALALAVLADLKVRKEGADLAQRISATACSIHFSCFFSRVERMR